MDDATTTTTMGGMGSFYSLLVISFRSVSNCDFNGNHGVRFGDVVGKATPALVELVGNFLFVAADWRGLEE